MTGERVVMQDETPPNYFGNWLGDRGNESYVSCCSACGPDVADMIVIAVENAMGIRIEAYLTPLEAMGLSRNIAERVALMDIHGKDDGRAT